MHFAAAGDFSSSVNAGAVLTAIGNAQPDLTVALGDLSYGLVGQESAWCDFVKARVGEGSPFELVAGNHEGNGQNGNINDFSACLPNQLPGVRGTYGREYYVDVPKTNPLVRMVMISPNIQFPDSTWDYAAGTPRYNWTAQAINSARAANIPWVVVSMHKPCLSLGEYGCDPGADLVNLLLDRKVDLVLTGHEHLYQRTKQLGLGASCTGLTIGSYNSACVKSAGSSFGAGVGTVFATVGTGGINLRDVNAADSEMPYFQTSSGLNSNPTFGFLDVVATSSSLNASFVRAAGGTFSDSFVITKGAAPANQPPVAAFGTTVTGLDVSADGSASSDADGTIASYDWDWGDGTSGAGVTATHSYATSGTYDVKLTVTDDDGDIGTVTHPVTVTTGPVVLASDDFERTVSVGWGTAPVGGAWTNTGSSSQSGVSGGTGRLSALTAGTGPSAFLSSISSTNLELRVDVTFDKVPVGGTSGVDQGFLLRRVNGEDYRAKVRLLPGGVVRVGLSRVAANGAQTVVVPEQVVSGLTYVAGEVLSIRAQAIGTSPTTLRARVWRGATEPSTWQVLATDSLASLQAPGAIGLHFYVAGSVTNAPIVARFDQLRAVVP